MRAAPLRGAEFGAATAAVFAIVTPVNNLIHQEQIEWSAVVTGSVFAFFLFGLIGTFSHELGSDIGDA
jgi:hypothetical protein